MLFPKQCWRVLSQVVSDPLWSQNFLRGSSNYAALKSTNNWCISLHFLSFIERSLRNPRCYSTKLSSAIVAGIRHSRTLSTHDFYHYNVYQIPSFVKYTIDHLTSSIYHILHLPLSILWSVPADVWSVNYSLFMIKSNVWLVWRELSGVWSSRVLLSTEEEEKNWERKDSCNPSRLSRWEIDDIYRTCCCSRQAAY